jgi:hypothetical protein
MRWLLASLHQYHTRHVQPRSRQAEPGKGVAGVQGGTDCKVPDLVGRGCDGPYNVPQRFGIIAFASARGRDNGNVVSKPRSPTDHAARLQRQAQPWERLLFASGGRLELPK